MKKKSLTKNSILNTVKSLMAIIFPLITFPYVSGVLGVENIGRYNFSNSVISYYLMLAALGISAYAVREGAALRDNKQALSEFASQIFTIHLLSTFVAYALFGISLAAVPKFRDYYDLLLVFSIEILFTTLAVDWLFIIFEEYTYITLRKIGFQLASLILMFVFIRDSDDVIIYCAITVFASAGSDLLNLFFMRKYARVRITKHVNLKKHLKPILIIFASTLAIKIYTSLDTVMLGFMLGDKGDYYVGLYAVAIKVYNVIRPLLTAATMVSIPRLAAYIGKSETEKANLTLSKIFNALFLVVLPAATGIFMISDKIILIIADASFAGAGATLKILCFAVVFSVFSTYFNQCVMIPNKLEKQFLIATVVSAAVDIILNAILIPILKIEGAAIATVSAEFTSMAMCCFFGRKKFRLTKIIKNSISVIVGCGAIVAICFAFSPLEITAFRAARMNTIVETLIVCATCIVAYGCVLLLFRNDVVFILLGKVFRRRKKTAEAVENVPVDSVTTTDDEKSVGEGKSGEE